MSWWVSTGNSTYKSSQPMQLIFCPVCKTELGRKEQEDSVSFHCSDCHAVYTFFPGLNKPTAKLDSDIAKTCQCPSCRYNRGEIDTEEFKIHKTSDD